MDKLTHSGAAALDYSADEVSVLVSIDFDYRAETTDKILIRAKDGAVVEPGSSHVTKHVDSSATVECKVQKQSTDLVKVIFVLGDADYKIYV